ncbi:hypothetical protein ACFQ3A_19480 [Sphaerisporangium aureirubrum]
MMNSPQGSGSSGDGTGIPRWVKVTGIVVAVLVVLVVALLLTGEHGPGRHSGGMGGNPSSTVAGEGNK